jgi:hypothetical protein
LAEALANSPTPNALFEVGRFAEFPKHDLAKADDCRRRAAGGGSLLAHYWLWHHLKDSDPNQAIQEFQAALEGHDADYGL